MVKGHNEIIILFMNCQDDVHIVVFFFLPNQEMKTKSLTFNENRQIFVTDSNKNVVSLLSIKFWDLLKIIQAVGKFYENLERVFSYQV